jgi:hypothetical protein
MKAVKRRKVVKNLEESTKTSAFAPRNHSQQSMQATSSGTYGIVASFCMHDRDKLKRSR